MVRCRRVPAKAEQSSATNKTGQWSREVQANSNLCWSRKCSGDPGATGTFPLWPQIGALPLNSLVALLQPHNFASQKWINTWACQLGRISDNFVWGIPRANKKFMLENIIFILDVCLHSNRHQVWLKHTRQALTDARVGVHHLAQCTECLLAKRQCCVTTTVSTLTAVLCCDSSMGCWRRQNRGTRGIPMLTVQCMLYHLVHSRIRTSWHYSVATNPWVDPSNVKVIQHGHCTVSIGIPFVLICQTLSDDNPAIVFHSSFGGWNSPRKKPIRYRLRIENGSGHIFLVGIDHPLQQAPTPKCAGFNTYISWCW